MFCCYLGEPRNFEIIANAGIGYIHNYTDEKEDLAIGTIKNAITQKLAIDFAWNFGNKKQWQFYVEPSLNYLIAGAKPDNGLQTCAYDINYSYMQLNVGINYKFKTSNDTHNFLLVEACDQNMIDALNAEINSLRGKDAEIDALKKEIEDLKKALKECEEKPAPAPVTVVEKEVEPNLPAIFYPLNKSIITPAQAQNVAIAATVLKNHPELKLQIKGYASPEGPHDNNNTLSINRAKAVKDLLVKKYKIDPSRITTEGCGETDKLFEIYEFNRVAMLYIER
jgi:outer membrane protein OmpA-like peptidoglycan-associated protein